MLTVQSFECAAQDFSAVSAGIILEVQRVTTAFAKPR